MTEITISSIYNQTMYDVVYHGERLLVVNQSMQNLTDYGKNSQYWYVMDADRNELSEHSDTRAIVIDLCKQFINSKNK